MEPITLCGAVIVGFGLWVEFESIIMKAVRIISKNSLVTTITSTTGQKPVYVKYLTGTGAWRWIIRYHRLLLPIMTIRISLAFSVVDGSFIVLLLFSPDWFRGIVHNGSEVVKRWTLVTIGNPVQNFTGYNWVGIPRHFPHLLPSKFICCLHICITYAKSFNNKYTIITDRYVSVPL